METKINDRITRIIKELKMNNNSFAKSINKSSTTINYIADGKSKPSYEVLEIICSTYPQVNADWLMRGEGEMFHEHMAAKPSKPSDSYLQDYLIKLEDRFIKMIEAKDRQLESKDTQIAGLQRILENVLGKSEDVAVNRSGIIVHPATKEVLFGTAQVG